jgi:hypothetical protein
MNLDRGRENLIAAAEGRFEAMKEARMDAAVAGRKAAQRLGIEHLYDTSGLATKKQKAIDRDLDAFMAGRRLLK